MIFSKTPLFICADCGARSGFVGAWLFKTLTKPAFDVGVEIGTQFHKEHFDQDNKIAKSFNGKKLRIRPDLTMINLHMYLSLLKDVYVKIPNFKYPEDSLETFTKMYITAKEWFDHDKKIDLTLYDRFINFSDTYNLSVMTELFQWFNNEDPSEKLIENFNSTNEKNFFNLPKNSSCEIAALVLQREDKLGLKEENRCWSIVDEYNHPDKSTLYDRVFEKINFKFYK